MKVLAMAVESTCVFGAINPIKDMKRLSYSSFDFLKTKKHL